MYIAKAQDIVTQMDNVCNISCMLILFILLYADMTESRNYDFRYN